MKEILLDLMCDLSPDEVVDRAQTLSSTIKQADEVEAEKKSSSQHYKEQLEALGGQIRKLSGIIRNRAESRPVTCAVLFHSPVTGTKRIVRKDTGELQNLAERVELAGATDAVIAMIDQVKKGKRKKSEPEYGPEPGQE